MEINPEFIAQRPLSYSALKAFRKSPKHYMLYLTQPRVQTDAMLLGTVVECLTLEPDRFEKRFMVIPKLNLRTNDGKAERERLMILAQKQNLTLIDEETKELAEKCRTALMDHSVSRTIIEHKRHTQVKLAWNHKPTGIPMIGYVDFESKAWETDFIIDLKTTANADPDEFVKQAAKLDYHIQAGAYLDGYPRCKFTFPQMAFVAVETDDPFNVSVFFCDNQYTDRARDEFHGSVNAFKYCMDNNLWHQGYEFRTMGTRDYFPMEIPGFVKQKFLTVNE